MRTLQSKPLTELELEKIGKGDGVKTFSFKSFLSRNTMSGNCAICGVKTKSIFSPSAIDGVYWCHGYGDNDGLDCRLVFHLRDEIKAELGVVDRANKPHPDQLFDHVLAEGGIDWRTYKRLSDENTGFLSRDISQRCDIYRDYRSYIYSTEWKIKADCMKKRKGWRCERCNKRPKNKDKDLHVHHLHYNTLYYETPEDLEVLCADCHKTEHGVK